MVHAAPASARVVSLVPSLTESLLSWGVVPVACTRFCEQPSLLHVGGTKDPDLDAIVALRPDLVLLCEEENRLEDYEALVTRGLRCHGVRIDDVDDVAPALGAVAALLGLGDEATAALRDLPPASSPSVPRRVFVPIWRRPWMTLSARTYGASVLRRLGFDPLFGDRTVRYPEVTMDEVVAARPDLVLLPTEPYPFKERHAEEWDGIAPAVLVDGQDLFWWGTRTPAALARLAEALG
jgi:ABC-type Fe3+-hydroxamate transport system substrate-binding protein